MDSVVVAWCNLCVKRATVRWWKRILFSLRLKVVQGKSKTTKNAPVTSSTDAKLDLTVNPTETVKALHLF